MSTLAAARADNFYYPPEWTPDQGGLNKFQGQHPLRERAKKLGEGILVIRFEMPFNVWCGGCHHMIAKGVRFNAEKKQVGNYLSTKIWSFVMKSPCCQTEIEVQTDPKNTEYVVVRGGERKVETYDAEEAGTVELPDKEDREKLADPFYKLEHGDEDIKKAKKTIPTLTMLQRVSDVKNADPYARNRELRSQLRAQKKRVAAETEDARKRGLGIRLLPLSKEDELLASKVRFGPKFDLNRQEKRAAIKASSIFAPPGIPSLQDGGGGSSRGGGQARLELVAKRRRIDVGGVKKLVTGSVKKALPGPVATASELRTSRVEWRSK